MFLNRKISMKYIVLCFLAFLFGVCIGVFNFSDRYSLNLSDERVTDIDIKIEISSQKINAYGSAKIYDEIAKHYAVNVLNDIWLRHGNYTEYDLDGRSPSALVRFYYGNEITDEIYFYYDVILYNGEYYGINVSQYNKLVDLCEKYGWIKN